MQDIKEYWRNMNPGSIPSKADITPLLKWLEQFSSSSKTHILDIGCGNGEISLQVHNRNFSVSGLDINREALTIAHQKLPDSLFKLQNAVSHHGLGCKQYFFDGVICQLLFSITGNADQRAGLVKNIHSVLKNKSRMFASFSGLSDDLNKEYRDLYYKDYNNTLEWGTYFSRDEYGNVLYETHHFSRNEIIRLLELNGFLITSLEEQIETSSRRKDQKARFYYVNAVSRS